MTFAPFGDLRPQSASPAAGGPRRMSLALGSARPARDVPLGGSPKRAMDLAIAVLVLLLAAPLMLMAAAAIMACDGGNPFFGHRRIGYGGRVFRCWKFRTMVKDADAALQRRIAADPAFARAWAERFKLDDDPRVTPIGRVLRKSSLDELPQLFNVLLGDMSCVGPRPVTAAELERYGHAAAIYLRARPGLTGLWQVSGRSRTSYETRVALDVAYVRSQSPALDMRILLLTAPALMDFGATS